MTTRFFTAERRRRYPFLAIFFLFAVTFFAFSVLCLSRDDAIGRQGMELDRLRAEIAVAMAENDGLRREIAALTSAERILSLAENEWGMVRPGEEDRFYWAAPDKTMR